MSVGSRLFPVPRWIMAGQLGTGWLGMLSSWALLGGGSVLAASSGAGVLTVDEGACVGYSSTVCGVANWGGVLAGVFTMAVATLFSVSIARGFGPPVVWWVLPALVACAAVVVFGWSWAGVDTVLSVPLAVTVVLGVVALALAVMVLMRGRAAVRGWVRLDGLDAREVPHRTIELVLPVASVLAAWAGAAFAVHVARLLTQG